MKIFRSKINNYSIDSFFVLGLSSAVPVPGIVNIVVGGDSSTHSSTTSVVAPTIHINVNARDSIEEKQRESCSYDTIDALPHVDHYRNLFSITSPEKKSRPTLEALHEIPRIRLGSTIDLNNELMSTLVPLQEQTIPVEVKPKVEVVKFGWIIGVLVR